MPMTMAHVEFRYVDESVPQDDDGKITLRAFPSATLLRRSIHFAGVRVFPETDDRMWEEGK